VNDNDNRMYGIGLRVGLPGAISRGARGNGVHIVKLFNSRTHYGRHCEPVSDPNAPDCRILHVQSQIFFTGV